MDKELAGQPRPKNYSQWLNVQEKTSNEWCYSRVCSGTRTFDDLYH